MKYKGFPKVRQIRIRMDPSCIMEAEGSMGLDDLLCLVFFWGKCIGGLAMGPEGELASFLLPVSRKKQDLL